MNDIEASIDKNHVTISFGQYSVTYSYYFVKMYQGSGDLQVIDPRDKKVKQLIHELRDSPKSIDSMIDSAIFTTPQNYRELDHRLNEEALVSYMRSLYRAGFTVKILSVPSFRKKKKLAVIAYRRRVHQPGQADMGEVPPLLTPANLSFSCFRVEKFDPGTDFLTLDVKILYSLNRRMFSSQRSDRLISKVVEEMKGESQEVGEFVRDGVLVPLEEEELAPYMFSVEGVKYALTRAGAVNVIAGRENLQKFFPHLLNEYRGRVLWVGETPTHPSCSRFHTLDFSTLNLDFITLYQSIKNTPAMEYFINALEQASGVSVIPGIVKTILSDVCSRGHIENLPFTKRIYNLRNHLETHGTRDDLGQLVSVLFDRFLDLDFLNAGRNGQEILSLTRLHMKVSDPYEATLQLGMYLFVAEREGYCIDTVVVNSSSLSHHLTRNAACNTYRPLLEQLLEWSSRTRFILTSHTQLPYSLPRIELGRGGKMTTYYHPLHSAPCRVEVENREGARFTTFVETPVVRTEVEDAEEIFESKFEEYYHRVIAFPERNQYSLISHKDFFSEHQKLTRVLEVIMSCRGRDNIEELHYFRDPEYQTTIGWLKKNGYIVSEVTGVTSQVERYFLRGKSYKLVKRLKEKVKKFCDQFSLPLDELKRQVYTLPFQQATGDDPNAYSVDTANFFLRCMVTARSIIAKGMDPNPDLLSLCGLWEPKTRFKDAALANGYITTRGMRAVLEMGERLALAPTVEKEDTEAPELEIVEDSQPRASFEFISDEIPDEVLEEEVDVQPQSPQGVFGGELVQELHPTPILDTQDLNMGRDHERGEEEKRDDRGNEKDWNYYKGLPAIRATVSTQLESSEELKEAILSIPLFRFLEGTLRKKVFEKTPNLSLKEFQTYGREEDLRKMYGLSRRQEEEILNFLISETGLNILSLLQRVDNYGKYFIVSQRCPLPERHMPPKAVTVIPEEVLKELDLEIDRADSPLGGIVPMVNYTIGEWKKALVNNRSKLKNRDKLQDTLKKMDLWSASQHDEITIQELALCNNILMSVQEMLGGMFLDDYKDEYIIRNIPETVLRDSLLKETERYQIVSFNLASLYPLLRKLGNADAVEQLRIEEDIRGRLHHMVKRIIIRKY